MCGEIGVMAGGGVCGERSLRQPPSFHHEASVPRKYGGWIPPVLAGLGVRREPQTMGATVLLDVLSAMGKEAHPSHECRVISLVRGLPEDVPHLRRHQRLLKILFI